MSLVRALIAGLFGTCLYLVVHPHHADVVVEQPRAPVACPAPAPDLSAATIVDVAPRTSLPGLLPAGELRSRGEFVDLTVATPTGPRRVLVLQHAAPAATF